MGYRQALSPRKAHEQTCDFLKNNGGAKHQILKRGGQLPHILIGCDAPVISNFPAMFQKENYQSIILKPCFFLQA